MQYLDLTNPRAKTMVGLRFGRLTVLGLVRKASPNKLYWHCACDCGNTTEVEGGKLRGGRTRSCGCLQREAASERMKARSTHGMTDTSAFRTWRGIKERCCNPGNDSYIHYGGRGIEVCAEWQDNFVSFFDHVSKLPHYGEKGYTIDRIDNDGNYEPGNVRWATTVEQRRNQRRCRRITIEGETRTAAEWSELSGVDARLIGSRIDSGWSEHDAVFRPARGPRLITANGETHTLTEWAHLIGVPKSTIHCRIARGHSEADAVRAEFAALAQAQA